MSTNHTHPNEVDIYLSYIHQGKNHSKNPCQIIQYFWMLTPLPPRFCSCFSLFVDNVKMINP